MAIAFRGVSNAAGQNAGTTASATTVSITPTLPASTTSGDRVFMVQCGSNTSGTAPANWTLVGTKDTVVGSGAVAAAGGLRYITVYYRDYDGVWTMPAMTLTSAAQNSHWIGAVSITPTAGSVFATPTISTVAGAFNAATTSYTDTSAASFTTHSGGFLIIGTCLNDNVTSTTPALTQSGATFGTVTERCDGGTATGNDVAGQVHTCSVTTGAAATTTFTQTLSAASQGETLFIEQTETVSTTPAFAAAGTTLSIAGSATTANIAVPSGVVTNSGIVVAMFLEAGTQTVTPPSGFSAVADMPAQNTDGFRMYIYEKRQTSATGAGETTGTYTFTISSGVLGGVAFAARFSGCGTSGSLFEVTNSALKTGSANATTPAVSVTTTGTFRLLVWLVANINGSQFTPAAGWTEHVEADVLAIDSKAQAAAGSSGSLTQTHHSNGPAAAWVGALKPVEAAASAGTGSGSYTWTGSAAGKRTPEATGSGSYTWAGTSAGARTSRGTGSGTYTWVGTSAGARTSRGTASGSYTWVGTAAGDTPPNRGTGSGSYTWAGSAAGKRTPKATGSGSYTWAGTAVGDTPPNRGTTSGSYTWAGTAAGKRTPKATGSGTYTWAGAAVGSAPAVGAKQGTAAGTYTWAGTTAGARTSRGATTGTYTWAGTATGDTPPNRGTTAGAYTWVGTGAGARTSRGTAAGTYTWAGTATGSAPAVGVNDGTAAGAYTFAGTAAGKRTPKAIGSGTYTWAGTATGSAPTVGVNDGTATGAYTWAGAAVGARTSRGSVTGAYGWDGAAIGWRVSRGATTGTYTFAGTATGQTPLIGAKSGYASGGYGWISFPGVGVFHPIGTAAGTYTWAGTTFFHLTAPVHPDRILAITIETREMTMPSEIRTITMPAEIRTITMPVENRVITVPDENRVIAVPAENRIATIDEETRLITM